MSLAFYKNKQKAARIIENTMDHFIKANDKSRSINFEYWSQQISMQHQVPVKFVKQWTLGHIGEKDYPLFVDDRDGLLKWLPTSD